MSTTVQVYVRLFAKPNTAGPANGTVIFSYGPGAVVHPGVHIDVAGNIEVAVVQKDIKIEFVLLTEEVSWGNEIFSVSFATIGNQNGEDLLWISPSNSKPANRWNNSDPLFNSFSIAQANKVLSVAMAKQTRKPPKRNYAYGLAVTFRKQGKPDVQVRDDPQIKNGGYGANFTLPQLFQAAVGGAMLGLLFAFAAVRFFF